MKIKYNKNSPTNWKSKNKVQETGWKSIPIISFTVKNYLDLILEQAYKLGQWGMLIIKTKIFGFLEKQTLTAVGQGDLALLPWNVVKAS